MEDPLPQQQYQIEFEKSTSNPYTKVFKGRAKHFCQDTPFPYLLDASDNTPRLFFVRNEVISKLKYDNSKKCFVGDATRKPFEGYDEYEPDEESELHCVKISPCQQYLAVMTDQYIWIYTLYLDFEIMKVDERKVDFKLEGNQFDDYMTIHWPPLSDSYIKNPHFFSMDSANKIRLHYIRDNTTVVPSHEELRCANFSHDGERILGINLANELCFMDPNTLETLSKKTIPELDYYKNAHVAHVFQIDCNHIAVGAFYSLPNQDENQLYRKFQSIVFILSGLGTPNSEIRAHGYQMDATYEILEDFYPSFKFQYLKEQNLLFYTHSDSPDINTLYIGKNENMIQFPSISLIEGTVRGFVLLKSLLKESTKKRKMQPDGLTKMTIHPKISVIILTSEGKFVQYDLKEICPEKALIERKIRKICKETILERICKETILEKIVPIEKETILEKIVPIETISSEGLEEQKQEKKEEVKSIEENKKGFETKLLNGQFTLGPNLFLKMEARPNLFVKSEEPEIICLDDDDEVEKKDFHKKLEVNNRAFRIGNENKGIFAMFPIVTKKSDQEKAKEEKKSGLFGDKENDGKLANKAFGGGLFSVDVSKGKENGMKKNEGRSALFGDFRIEKKEEIK